MKEKKQFDVTFTTNRDMKKIYHRLHQLYPDGFPEIFVVDELPDNHKIMRKVFCDGRSVILVVNGNDEEVISLLRDEIEKPHSPLIIKDGFIPYHRLTELQISRRIMFACYISEILEMPVRQIGFSTEETIIEQFYAGSVTIFRDTHDIQKSLYQIMSDIRLNWQALHFSDQFFDQLLDDSNYYNSPSLSTDLITKDVLAFGIKLESIILDDKNCNGKFLHNISSDEREELLAYAKTLELNISQATIDNIRKLIELNQYYWFKRNHA